MKIHEYQARRLFQKYNVPVPFGEVAQSVAEAREIAEKIASPVMIKAQVLAGGRGKAGAVKYAGTVSEAEDAAAEILGKSVDGLIVKKVLVAKYVEAENEFYLGIVVDRRTKKIAVMAGSVGGVDVEEASKKIHKIGVNPNESLFFYDAFSLCRKIYFSDEKDYVFGAVFLTACALYNLYNLFVKSDALLAEINPLALDKFGKIWALDAKIDIDDNSLHRQPFFRKIAETIDDGAMEIEARRKNLSFVKLNGNVGCISNGAGLAMATMDLLKFYGGAPANFLDIGGSSGHGKMRDALNILSGDENVKVIFVNIFGGITRCDDIAGDIIKSFSKIKDDVRLVVRLAGTNKDEAEKILAGKKIIIASSMSDGAKKAVRLAKEGRGSEHTY